MSKESYKSQKRVRREKQQMRKARYQWIGFGALVLILLAALTFISPKPKVQPLDDARLAFNPTLGSEFR